MPVAWSDPGNALIAGGIWVGIVAGILLVLVWDARRRRAPSIVLDVTGAVARMWVALMVLAAIAGLVGLVAAPTTTLTDLPVSVPWPTALPCDVGGEVDAARSLYCARLPTATAEVVGLSGGLKAMIFAGGLLAYVVAAAPGVLVAVLCAHAAAGRPFARAASRWLIGSAVVIVVAGTASEVVLALARFFAAAEVLPDASSAAAATAPTTFQMVVPLWPIGAALALAALSVVFRHGAALRLEAEALRRDTEGLV